MAKKNWPMALLLAFIFTWFSANAAFAEKADFENAYSEIYQNERFDYEFTFPLIFQSMRENADNSGLSMASAEGDYTLTVQASFNVENQTGHILLAQAKNRSSHIIESNSSDEHYALVYTDHGGKDGKEKIFSEYGVVDKNRIVKYLFIYPLEDHEYLKKEIFLSLQPQESYIDLVSALSFSQMLHYDSFTENSGPDALTQNMVLFYLVQAGLFENSTIVDRTGKNIYFDNFPGSEGSVKENMVYLSPDKLYAVYFAQGTYKYPPLAFPLATGTQTGLTINNIELPYQDMSEIKEVKDAGDYKVVSINLKRATGNTAQTLGTATITLKKDPHSYFGYTIASYTAKYNKFSDLKL